MKKIIVILIISLNSITFCNAQNSSLGNINDNLISLKEFVSDWSCEPFVKGTFTVNLEISIIEDKLILKKNWSINDQNFGYPEYTKTTIELKKINRINAQDSDKSCAGIKIYTEPGGIKIYEKYKNSNEIPYTLQHEIKLRQEFGWVDDEIRLNNNERFISRSNQVIKSIKEIAILSGNVILKKSY